MQLLLYQWCCWRSTVSTLSCWSSGPARGRADAALELSRCWPRTSTLRSTWRWWMKPSTRNLSWTQLTRSNHFTALPFSTNLTALLPYAPCPSSLPSKAWSATGWSSASSAQLLLSSVRSGSAGNSSSSQALSSSASSPGTPSPPSTIATTMEAPFLIPGGTLLYAYSSSQLASA